MSVADDPATPGRNRTLAAGSHRVHRAPLGRLLRDGIVPPPAASAALGSDHATTLDGTAQELSYLFARDEQSFQSRADENAASRLGGDRPP